MRKLPQKAEGESQNASKEKIILSDSDCLYDVEMLYDAVTKITSVNYAGVPSLTWGSVKLNLQTLTVDDMR